MYILYTYIHTYVHTHTYIHTYIHTSIHTYIHTYIPTYIHTYIHNVTVPYFARVYPISPAPTPGNLFIVASLSKREVQGLLILQDDMLFSYPQSELFLLYYFLDFFCYLAFEPKKVRISIIFFSRLKFPYYGGNHFKLFIATPNNY